jgi:hypothetical protein
MYFFGTHANIPQRRMSSSESGQRLIGYILYPRNFAAGSEGALRLDDHCLNAGFRLIAHEEEAGNGTNPFRPILWKTLRRLMCAKCEPKRMPLSMINFDDFVYQALAPCSCGKECGYDGLAVARLEHILADHAKTSTFIVRMAMMKKHLIAEDGICLSCCHPATKELAQRTADKSVNRAG